MRLRAAIFNAAGVPVAFAFGSPVQLNANARAGQTWRVVDDMLTRLADVPPLASLPKHASLVETA